MLEFDQSQLDGYQSRFNRIYKVLQCRRHGSKLKIHRWCEHLNTNEPGHTHTHKKPSGVGIDESAKNAKTLIHLKNGGWLEDLKDHKKNIGEGEKWPKLVRWENAQSIWSNAKRIHQRGGVPREKAGTRRRAKHLLAVQKHRWFCIVWYHPTSNNQHTPQTAHRAKDCRESDASAFFNYPVTLEFIRAPIRLITFTLSPKRR